MQWVNKFIQSPSDEIILKCNDMGGYHSLCRGQMCVCLNATDGNPTGPQYAKDQFKEATCGRYLVFLSCSDVVFS